MIKEEFNPDSGLFLYSVICDGCEESLPPRGSDLMALTDAAVAGWLMRKPSRRFSGIAYSDYCPKCRKKEDSEHKEMVSRVRVQFGLRTSGSAKKE